MKLFGAILLTVVVCMVGGTAFPPKQSVSDPSKTSSVPPPQSRVLVDGAATPEKIPEELAYSLLFRMIGRRETEAEKNRIRSYLKQALGCNACDKSARHNSSVETQEADINALIGAAEEFDLRVTALDLKVAQINGRYHPEHLTPVSVEDKQQLTHLQRQKESIVAEVVASLPDRLSAEGAKNLRKFVKENVRRKVRIIDKHCAASPSTRFAFVLRGV